MRVTTKIVWDIDGKVLEHDWFQYEGIIALCGGGPSSEQRQAASAQANLSNQSAATSKEMLGFYKDQYHKIDPFETQRMNNGLPFFNSLTDYSSGLAAKAAAPARGALLRSTSSMGSLPSGFKSGLMSDFDANRARAFDQGLAGNLFSNEQAKNNAAQALTGQQQLANPLGWQNSAMSGNQSIMQAPLQSPGIGGMLGGLAGGALSAVPF